MAIEDAFTDMDPDLYKISRVLMVGAEPGVNAFLGGNDYSLLRTSVKWLQAAGFNFSDDVMASAESPRHLPSKGGVEIINIGEEFGGRDFLKENLKGDLVVICNIPLEANEEYSKISRSFLQSAHHTARNWADRVAATGAKAVWVAGGIECLDVAHLKSPFFAAVNLLRDSGAPNRALMSKDLMERGEAYFYSRNLPLADVPAKMGNDAEHRVNIKIMLGSPASGFDHRGRSGIHP